MQTVLDKLVGQADKKGVTLAETMVNELSPDDIDQMQQYLRREMEENYAAIEDFMRDIEVPGNYDFSSMDESELSRLQENLNQALSDAPVAACPEA